MDADRFFLCSLVLGFILSVLLFLTAGKFRFRRFRLRRTRKAVTVPVPFGLFLMAFGLAGLLLHSVVLAAIIGSVFYGGASLLIRRFLADTAEELQGSPLNGMTGHVSLAIPERGTGRIAFIAGGKRVTVAARSLKGSALPLGTRILIVEFQDRIALVDAV